MLRLEMLRATTYFWDFQHDLPIRPKNKKKLGPVAYVVHQFRPLLRFSNAADRGAHQHDTSFHGVSTTTTPPVASASTASSRPPATIMTQMASGSGRHQPTTNGPTMWRMMAASSFTFRTCNLVLFSSFSPCPVILPPRVPRLGMNSTQ
jgi:hypothetical protein